MPTATNMGDGRLTGSRADASHCSCLAAWIDSEPCICGEPIGAPMELSAKKLDQASRLVSKIKHMDLALTKIKNDRLIPTKVVYGETGNYPDFVELRLPADIATALIRTMRFHAMVELSQTGVTSTASGHRPVVSA